jgi:hypothetical protein
MPRCWCRPYRGCRTQVRFSHGGIRGWSIARTPGRAATRLVHARAFLHRTATGRLSSSAVTRPYSRVHATSPDRSQCPTSQPPPCPAGDLPSHPQALQLPLECLITDAPYSSGRGAAVLVPPLNGVADAQDADRPASAAPMPARARPGRRRRMTQAYGAGPASST